MSVDIYWRIAMEGDASALSNPVITRGGFGPAGIAPRNGDGSSPLDYMSQVAQATEAAGFVGGLMPSFPSTDDPWAAAAALAHETRSYRFMVAFQPGFMHPVQAARMSATLQLATGGRLVYNMITGGGGPEQLWWADPVEHDDRYARTTEYLNVLKGVWTGGGSYQHRGRFYEVDGGGLPAALAEQPFPEIFFSGSSRAAIAAAGEHADYYLSWLEPLEPLAEKFQAVRERADAAGLRAPRFAVRVDVLARGSDEEAWDVIRAGWHSEHRHSAGGGGDSVGAQRSREFAGSADGDFRELEVAPGIWGGFQRLRPGPPFGLVGSYERVAGRLDDLMDLGVDAFILAGVPHLEEARRVGARVLPLLKGRTT